MAADAKNGILQDQTDVSVLEALVRDMERLGRLIAGGEATESMVQTYAQCAKKRENLANVAWTRVTDRCKYITSPSFNSQLKNKLAGDASNGVFRAVYEFAKTEREISAMATVVEAAGETLDQQCASEQTAKLSKEMVTMPISLVSGDPLAGIC